jgi:hypothetical protein
VPNPPCGQTHHWARTHAQNEHRDQATSRRLNLMPATAWTKKEQLPCAGIKKTPVRDNSCGAKKNEEGPNLAARLACKHETQKGKEQIACQTRKRWEQRTERRWLDTAEKDDRRLKLQNKSGHEDENDGRHSNGQPENWSLWEARRWETRRLRSSEKGQQTTRFFYWNTIKIYIITTLPHFIRN